MWQVTCFKCRQPGHKVDECPNRGAGDDASGICFKCGSSEHTSRVCKVSVEPGGETGRGDFPYAKCFICKEVGHLARSCPDNPRGLYPNGGGCKLCGSVEHLKANCPEKKKRSSVEDQLDGIGLVLANPHASVDAEDPIPNTRTRKTVEKSHTSKKKKVVKF